MTRKISVIGLGYVGLPVAVAFGEKQRVIAFDINQHRIETLKKGIDHTGEITKEKLSQTDLHFTSHPEDLREADFHIIAVPTPVNLAKQPDLACLISASKTLGAQLKKGDIVVYESTVYPGVTEEECAPVLEKYSGLKSGVDFFLGYSPERINPGDPSRTFSSIRKVVSGQTPEVLDIIAETYGSVVTAGVYKASSIKVAEAAKVIENTQRDLNIALINELSIIFNKLHIDTTEVLEAAGTKWNFLPFRPGLVGGHCIGVDPYYLTHKAEDIGYHPEVILAGRRINDSMGRHVAERVVRLMLQKRINVADARVLILGLTFKENCPDLRNTRVTDIIDEFRACHADIDVYDPWVDPAEARHEYGLDLVPELRPRSYDAIVLTVAHHQFTAMGAAALRALGKPECVLFDVKSVLPRDAVDGRL